MASRATTESLIEPYGGVLVDLLVPPEEREETRARASTLPRIKLTLRTLCDLEILATGGFSPLRTFLNRDDYLRVTEEMRLSTGELFPIPITCGIDPAADVQVGREITLTDTYDNSLAILHVDEIYERDPKKEAHFVCGTRDPRHPLVAEMQSWGKLNVTGRLRVFDLPRHFDFKDLRLSPSEVRSKLTAMGRRNVVAFQTRNPLHRAHEELTKRSASQVGGTLLLHPVVGMTKPGDIDHYTRVRSYKTLAEHYYERDRTMLALIPLAMRMAGPREALWHAIIRRNYGANHLIVGRDHASPGNDSDDRPFYQPYEAQRLLEQHSAELGVTPLPFAEILYLPEDDHYEEVSRVPAGKLTIAISATDIKTKYLDQGHSLPSWLMRAQVAKVLEHAHPPRDRQGFCVWFTGLSGAGKSTIANILAVNLLERGRQVTVLDGDVVRANLSEGLGFSKEGRDANIRRIGFVAAEIVRHGGACICAAVSPYRATRNECRAMFAQEHFIEIFVNTPLDVCEKRDAKGMYQKARAGKIKNFTGVDDPYEEPLDPEIVLDTVNYSPEENAAHIIARLVEQGFVHAASFADGPSCSTQDDDSI